MRIRTDRPIELGTWSVMLSLCISAPLLAQDLSSSGAALALPGLCRARDTGDGPWRSLIVGGALVAGSTIVCLKEGRLVYTLPSSGGEVVRQVRVGEEVVVARGRTVPTLVEGSRPGLRAEVAPALDLPESQLLAELPWPNGPKGLKSPDRVRLELAIASSMGALIGHSIGGKRSEQYAFDAANYIAEVREAARGDETQVVAHVAAVARLDCIYLEVVKQTVAQWLAEGDVTSPKPPEGAASSSLDVELRQRGEKRLSAMGSRLRAARAAALGYENVAARLQVTPEGRKALDAQIGRLRVGVRQLEDQEIQLVNRVFRARPAAGAASAPP